MVWASVISEGDATTPVSALSSLIAACEKGFALFQPAGGQAKVAIHPARVTSSQHADLIIFKKQNEYGDGKVISVSAHIGYLIVLFTVCLYSFFCCKVTY